MGAEGYAAIGVGVLGILLSVFIMLRDTKKIDKFEKLEDFSDEEEEEVFEPVLDAMSLDADSDLDSEEFVTNPQIEN